MTDSTEKAALENSTARLYTHVAQKGFQVGAIVGTSVLVPVMAFRRRQRRMQAANAAFLPTALRTVGRSAAYGTVGTCAPLSFAIQPICKMRRTSGLSLVCSST